MLIKRLFFIFLVPILFVACSEDEGSPANVAEICKKNKSSNEFIAVHRDGRYHVVHKKNLESYLATYQSDILWYEPNYKISFRNENFQHPTTNQKVMAQATRELWGRLGFDNYYSSGYFGQGITVAVVDTGVYLDSPYLEDRWLRNQADPINGIDEDGNGLVDDYIGWNFHLDSFEQEDEVNHGTQIAHLIAGDNDTPGGPGGAPMANILPVDFMDAQGGTEVNAVKSIDYAISHGAKIINNSWSIACSQLLRTKYKDWQSKNVLLVHASGNNYRNLASQAYNSSNFQSANYLSVGSVDYNLDRAPFSNYGENVILYTYGVDLTVTGRFWRHPDEGVVIRKGTSYSAGIVSAAAALVWSKYPNLSATELKKILINKAKRSNGINLLAL